MATPQPQKFNWLPLGIFALLIIVLGGLYALRGDKSGRPGDRQRADAEESEQSRRDKMRGANVQSAGSGKSSSRTDRTSGDDSTTGAATSADAAETTSPPERTTEDPMGYVVHDFRNHQMPLTGFKLDNIVETEEGLTLGPKTIDDSESTDGLAARIGTIESPPLALVAASNLIAPNWKEMLPADSNIQIELSASVDQNDWTEWWPIDRSDAEMSPTYPDGAPNPNYGNTPGTHVAFGLKLYPYVRYRMTMTAAGEKAPVFQQMRVYHTDGTGGNGVLANQPEPVQPETMPNPQQPPPVIPQAE
jgi:hypothetical protein